MKIEFFSTVKGVAESYPVKEAKRDMPNWMYEARKAFSEKENKREITLVRCPGIVDSLTTGYIVYAWHDIDLISNQQDGSLKAFYPGPELEELLQKPPLQVQTGEGIGKFIPKRPWSNINILKINTPWHLKSDQKFIMVPLPYTDKFEIEACQGILDPSISSEINVQLWVNGWGQFTIKAGTPLCQIIPLSNEKFDLEVRDMNENDKEWIDKRKYLNNSAFIFNKPLLKSAYRNFLQVFRKTK